MTAFADLHRPGEPLVLPNAWDFASAAALVKAGFQAIGTTSLGVASAAGLPDGTGATRAQTIAVTRRLGSLPCMLTVDIEGGFSPTDDVAAVVALAREVADAGAVGVNLEDGRENARLATIDMQVRLIRAVKESAPDLFVNARTDTYWLNRESPDLDETIARAKAYEDAGADGIFVPGLIDYPDIAAVTSAIRRPLNVLYLPGQKTVSQLAALGVARISYGSLLFRASLQAAVNAALIIKQDRNPTGALPSYQEINELASI